MIRLFSGLAVTICSFSKSLFNFDTLWIFQFGHYDTLFSVLYRDGIHPQRVKVEISPPIKGPSLPEHAPEDVTAGLCQHGVDEEVLLLQCFRQRTTRSGILLLNGGITGLLGNHIHSGYGVVLGGGGLMYLVPDIAYQNLPGCLGVAEIHPVNRCLFVIVRILPVVLQESPQVKPGTDVVRTGNDYVRQPGGILVTFLP